MSRPSRRRDDLTARLDQAGRRSGAQAALFSHAVADRLGLNRSDFECLDTLDWTGPITAGRLAELTGLTTGAITGIVDRLEGAGLVRRDKDQSDRRKVILVQTGERTDEGEGLYEGLMRGYTRLVDDLSTADLEVVVRWMEASNQIIFEQILHLRGVDGPT